MQHSAHTTESNTTTHYTKNVVTDLTLDICNESKNICLDKHNNNPQNKHDVKYQRNKPFFIQGIKNPTTNRKQKTIPTHEKQHNTQN
jgi:hypothetical protein